MYFEYKDAFTWYICLSTEQWLRSRHLFTSCFCSRLFFTSAAIFSSSFSADWFLTASRLVSVTQYHTIMLLSSALVYIFFSFINQIESLEKCNCTKTDMFVGDSKLLCVKDVSTSFFTLFTSNLVTNVKPVVHASQVLEYGVGRVRYTALAGVRIT